MNDTMNDVNSTVQYQMSFYADYWQNFINNSGVRYVVVWMSDLHRIIIIEDW